MNYLREKPLTLTTHQPCRHTCIAQCRNMAMVGRLPSDMDDGLLQLLIEKRLVLSRYKNNILIFCRLVSKGMFYRITKNSFLFENVPHFITFESEPCKTWNFFLFCQLRIYNLHYRGIQ